jgi:hypothetical protein
MDALMGRTLVNVPRKERLADGSAAAAVAAATSVKSFAELMALRRTPTPAAAEACVPAPVFMIEGTAEPSIVCDIAMDEPMSEEGAPVVLPAVASTPAPMYRTLDALLLLYPSLEALQTSGAEMKGAEATLLIQHYDLEVNKYGSDSLVHNGLKLEEGVVIRDPKKFNAKKHCNNGIFGAYGPRGKHSEESAWRNYKNNTSGAIVEAYWHFDMSFPDDADVCFQSADKVKGSAVRLSNKQRVSDVERFWSNRERALADIRNRKGCVRQTPNRPEYLFPQLHLASRLTAESLADKSTFVKLHAFMKHSQAMDHVDIRKLSRDARCLLYSHKPMLLRDAQEDDVELITVAVASDPRVLQWAPIFSDDLVKNAMALCAAKACTAMTQEPRLEEKVKFLTPDVLRLGRQGALRGTQVLNIIEAFFSADVPLSTEHLSVMYSQWPDTAKAITRAVLLEDPPQRVPMRVFEELFESDPGMEALLDIAQTFRKEAAQDASLVSYVVSEKHMLAAVHARPTILRNLASASHSLEITHDMWTSALALDGTLWTCLPAKLQADDHFLWLALKQNPEKVLPSLPDATRAREDVRAWAISTNPVLAIDCPGASDEEHLAAVLVQPRCILKLTVRPLALIIVALRRDTSLLPALFPDAIPESLQYLLATELPTIAVEHPTAFKDISGAAVMRVVEWAIKLGWDTVHSLLASKVEWSKTKETIDRILIAFPTQAALSRLVSGVCTSAQWLGIIKRALESQSDLLEELLHTPQDIPARFFEETWMLLVRHDPDNIAFCPKPSEIVQSIAVALKRTSVQHIQHPSEMVTYMAVMRDPTCKQLIKSSEAMARVTVPQSSKAKALATVPQSSKQKKKKQSSEKDDAQAASATTEMAIDDEHEANALCYADATAAVSSPSKKHKAAH